MYRIISRKRFVGIDNFQLLSVTTGKEINLLLSKRILTRLTLKQKQAEHELFVRDRLYNATCFGGHFILFVLQRISKHTQMRETELNYCNTKSTCFAADEFEVLI